ncbi:MAG: hypothetical protein JWR44_1831 [Hymenobacter sp.]|jgi:hypothetical protein|nr:hypothetical protein [Hymenobacter sp.]
MKTTVLTLLAAALFALPAHAQKIAAAKVPAAATAAFKNAFPGVNDAKWEKEDGHFEAGFTQGGNEMSALITPAGELLETETEIRPSELPVPVRDVLATRYKAAKVTEAAKIVSRKTGAVTYEAEVTEGGKKHDIIFNADGQEVTPK